jgi:hypothetical protein
LAPKVDNTLQFLKNTKMKGDGLWRQLPP